MTRRPRLNHGAAFKARGALEAVKDERTPADLAQQYDVYPNRLCCTKPLLIGLPLTPGTFIPRFS